MQSPKPDKASVSTEKFIARVRRGNICGSYNYATETAAICRLIVAHGHWKNAKGLIHLIQDYGKKMQEAKPSELVIGNVIKRILFLIREEQAMSVDERQDEEERKLQELHDVFAIEDFRLKRSKTKILSLRESGMFRVLEEDAEAKGEDGLEEIHGNLQSSILEEIDGWVDGLPGYAKSISNQAINHIHSEESIMTFGYSKTVKEFLTEAGSKRKIKVFVAESAPSYNGRKMAQELAEQSIDTTLISDAAIFSIMSRVNKVILGTHAVMADGGLLAQAGTHVIALAAKTFKIPLIVCAAVYKLSPLFPSDLESLQELRSPAEVLPFEELIGSVADVEIYNPSWDYIPPELVSLFITNSQPNIPANLIPSYIYRVLAELYHPKD